MKVTVVEIGNGLAIRIRETADGFARTVLVERECARTGAKFWAEVPANPRSYHIEETRALIAQAEARS